MSREIHVAKTGLDTNSGTSESPLKTIQKAADLAQAGDTVIVHEGVYRESVNPIRGGLDEVHRITYRAAEGERVHIKGSERITDWKKEEGSIWSVEIPDPFFGSYNPYREKISGDWLIFIPDKCHAGDVYLNGRSFYEAFSYEALLDPPTRTRIIDNWTKQDLPILDPDQTRYLWYLEEYSDSIKIYANFHDFDPNEELVEINVRQSCFYPKRPGLNYISVQGFEMSQAATLWSPPTADQVGLLGVHWSKGWIIEDNIIHDSKCSAISLGKDYTLGDMYRTKRKNKSGYQYQLEGVFKALESGWSKEHVGSHTVRNNIIYDCGQNGIVGNMCPSYSQIYGNKIYNIGLKREFYGHEIGGIKFHAAIDVEIFDNLIRNCSLGLWLDWQAQGSRVHHNVFYDNSRDFYIEVTHGPQLVDHNIFGSVHSLENHAQGTAFIHNLFLGKSHLYPIIDRSTPYHFPHSTKVKGCAFVYGGDDRYYNNLFIVNHEAETIGTHYYDIYTPSLETYMADVEALEPGDEDIFIKVKQPVYISDNVYMGKAKPYQYEDGALSLDDTGEARIYEEDGKVYLEMDVPRALLTKQVKAIHSHSLPTPRIVEELYEDSNGNSIDLSDGNNGEEAIIVGPLQNLKEGHNKLVIYD